MDNSTNSLSQAIADFVSSTPVEIVQSVIKELKEWYSDKSRLSKARLFDSIHSPDAKAKLIQIMDLWGREYFGVNLDLLALAIDTSLNSFHLAQIKSIELIWTGPITIEVPMRRTDQALIDLINCAKKRLLIVSFAVYKADKIIKALEIALKRGVEVKICLEDTSEGKGKVSFDGWPAFDHTIFRLAKFYYWPLEKREKSEDGKYGSLHAKMACADGERIFISSANLTGYAMDWNMEMGILIKDSGVTSLAEDLFDELIITGILQKAVK